MYCASFFQDTLGGCCRPFPLWELDREEYGFGWEVEVDVDVELEPGPGVQARTPSQRSWICSNRGMLVNPIVSGVFMFASV